MTFQLDPSRVTNWLITAIEMTILLMSKKYLAKLRHCRGITPFSYARALPLVKTFVFPNRWPSEAPRPLSIGADHLYSGSAPQGVFHGLLDEMIFYSGGLDAMQVCNQYLAFCMGNLAGVSCDTECLGD